MEYTWGQTEDFVFDARIREIIHLPSALDDGTNTFIGIGRSVRRKMGSLLDGHHREDRLALQRDRG